MPSKSTKYLYDVKTNPSTDFSLKLDAPVVKSGGYPTRPADAQSSADRDPYDHKPSADPGDAAAREHDYHTIADDPISIDMTFVSDGSANGDDQANTIHGSSSNDVIHGYGGNDIIFGLGDDDVLYGDGGHDQLIGGDGNDQLIGGKGNDELFGNAGDDSLDGGDGADSLLGGQGDDHLFGGAGGDLLDGGHGADLLSGGAGSDELHGGSDSDEIYGGSGNDHLFGGDGWDRLEGGDGDDVLTGGAGTDEFFGGDGRDMVDYSASTGAWEIDLGAGMARSLEGTVVEGLDSIESARGGSGNDIMIGVDTGSWLYGEGGHDQITGGAFNDLLDGGAGRDEIFGGRGADRIDGGAGADDLFAQQGDDFVFAGDGNDFVADGIGDDVVDLGQGDDRFSWNGGNDVVSTGGGADSIRIELWANNEAHTDERAEWSAGGTLRIEGFEGDDTMTIVFKDDVELVAGAPAVPFAHYYSPDENGDGTIDQIDGNAFMVGDDLHVRLLSQVNLGYGGPKTEFEEVTLIFADTTAVDPDLFYLG